MYLASENNFSSVDKVASWQKDLAPTEAY